MISTKNFPYFSQFKAHILPSKEIVSMTAKNQATAPILASNRILW
jgi:hypothetical protein